MLFVKDGILIMIWAAMRENWSGVSDLVRHNWVFTAIEKG